MGKIKLKNIKIYSNHGCLHEESLIGSEYVIQLEVKTDFSKSCITDKLEDTVDYVALNAIIKDETIIRSKLLETVANRIINRIFIEHSSVTKAKIEISKTNPPLNGDVESVSIIIKRKDNLKN